MASPRYVAAHVIMPSFLREQGAGMALDAIAHGDADFFIPVWMAAGFRFTPRLTHLSRDDYRLGTLTLPMPREDTEAYLVAVVGRVADPSYLRYFLLEASRPALDDEPGTMLCEWSGTSHLNHGAGPPFTRDLNNDVAAFGERILTICTQQPS